MPFPSLNQRGFSLPELLIALMLAGLVGMAGYTVFASSNRSTVGQEDVTEAQQNVRVAMDVLSKDIRGAGFGLPDPPFSLSIGGTSHEAAVSIVNSSTGADTLTVLGIGLFAGQLDTGGSTDCNTNSSTKLCLDAVSRFQKSDNSFNAERRYISLDGIKFYELASTQGELGSKKLALASGDQLDRNYNGSNVFIIQAMRYSLNTTNDGCSAANPCLTRRDFAGDNEVLAQNIEDLQLAFSRFGSAAFTNNASISTDNEVSAVRATIVGRTRRTVQGGGDVSRRPAVEDRTEGAVDNYRRRVLTSVIKVRNPRSGAL